MHPRVKRLLETHPAPWSLKHDATEGFIVADGEGDHVVSYEDDDEAFAAGLVEAINHAATSGPFLADVRGLLLTTSVEPIKGLEQAWLLLGELVFVLRAEMDLPHDKRSVTRVREDLVRLATVAWRTARDLGMESQAAAVSLDIPF